MSHPDLSFRINGVKDVIGLTMADKDVIQCLHSQWSLPKAGWHAPIQIATKEKHVRFIERDPIADTSKGGDYLLHVHQEFSNRPIFMPRIFLMEPSGMSEVMKRDHGFYIVPTKSIDDVLIMSDGLPIPLVFLRLYPTPL
jgi:hypothetical protein